MLRHLIANAALALAIGASTPGCLYALFWPDPALLTDAGLDGGTPPPDAGDAGPEDAGPDTGPTDAGNDADLDGGRVCELRVERSCGDEEDDDCDGLTDCDDFDCARTLDCCAGGGEIWSEDFAGSAARWDSLPRGATPVVMPSSGTLNRFGADETPRALWRRDCVPVDLGVSISVRLQALGEPAACSTGSACENYAAIVLTAERDTTLGRPLADELAVRLSHEAMLRVTQAGEDLVTPPATSFGTGPVDVLIELTPGTDPSGEEYVFAHVTATSSAQTFELGTASEPVPLVPRSYLVGGALGCEEARGLYVAIEGAGNRASADNVIATSYQCANPSHFGSAGGVPAQLEGSDLGLATRWSSGGIGAPTLTSYFTLPSDTEPTWDLLVDGTNVARSILEIDVRLSIGGAQTNDPPGRMGWTARRGGLPLLGLDPPECAMGVEPVEGCAARRSVREPHLFVPVLEATRVRPSAGVAHPLVVARERLGMPTVFDLELTSLGPTDTVPAPTTPLLSAGSGDLAACRSLRDPLLLPRGDAEASAGYFLLYTCVRAAGMPSVIRASRLDALLRVVETDPMPVLDPSMGFYAAKGVSGVDGVAFFEGDRVTYRVWFVGRDLAERASIGFAEASGPAADATLPALRPYVANPVLEDDDPVLGTCPLACGIESIASARSADSPSTVRLVVTRSVDEAGMPRRYELVLLDQVWPRAP